MTTYKDLYKYLKQLYKHIQQCMNIHEILNTINKSQTHMNTHTYIYIYIHTYIHTSVRTDTYFLPEHSDIISIAK